MSKSFKNAIRVAELCAKGTPPFERERIHLCNWYVTLVRPGKELCDDQFQCIVPIKMTKFDIKNYFEKIYKINVHKVETRIQMGKWKPLHAGISARKIRTPDYKVAYVTMVDETFKFPSMFEDFVKQREKEIAEKKEEDTKEEHEKQLVKGRYTMSMGKAHEVAGGTGDALKKF